MITRVVTIGAVAAGLLTACGGEEKAAPETVTQTQTSYVAAPSAGPTVAAPAPANTVAAAPASFTMPNLIGRDLQAAQDAMQSATGNPMLYSTSTDLMGEGRNQMVDRNWQVCTSSPAPGETFTEGTPVNFGVVRIDVESCP
jgi:hypothetical protein